MSSVPRTWVRRLQKRLEAQPPAQPEDSLLLRVLTQLLVLIGIFATDVAASTSMSFWAVPLSIGGAYWSWTHRRQPNISIKFCLAILMLLALGAFFVGLRGELNDTRLVLAQLLVQVQVLHTFDLPRRKDLGYSMVIGLILISVACTLSQTMMFGGLLLIFLAIALPVLMLDYRSRLGLLPQGWNWDGRRSGMSLKQVGIFFLVVLSLGLSLFAVMPRLPGYQLRTFPMSAPPQMQQNADTRQIINPGYVSRGRDRNGEGRGTGGQTRGDGFEKGQVDEEFYYGFNQRINQNLRGQMKPKVVMRVRSQAPGFWRVLSFDRYLGQGWEISRSDRLLTLNRPTWSYQFFIPRSVRVSQTKEIVQTYTMVADLPNLIPALTYPKELYFPTPKISADPEGNLRSPTELIEGLTYTVISEVPIRDRTKLGEATQDYPDTVRDRYLEVPEKIRAKVRQKAEALLATSPKPITSPYEQALFLTQAVKQRFQVKGDLPFFEPNDDMIESFLFKNEGGYPDHFSTTLTVLLRSIGLPARLAVGFGPGEFNPFTGLYIVRNTDAYAVTEVFFPDYGWFAFDPIPGHELIPPSPEEDRTFSVLQQFWHWVAGWLPSPVSGGLTQIFGAIAAAITGLIGLFTQGGWGIFAGLLILTGLAFGIWLGCQAWRRWRYQRQLAQLPPMEQLYRQMVDWLGQRGVEKSLAQTPLEYANYAQQQQPVARSLIQDISQAYVQWRYGGRSPDVGILRRQWQIMVNDNKRTWFRSHR